MTIRKLLVAAPLMLLSCGLAAGADEVRYYEQDGVTYREARRIVRRPVAETRYEEHDRTVYRERLDVELRESVRNYTVPVTEYRWQSYWQGRFNPFVQPYLAQRLVPCTRWEARSEVVRIPVTRRELVPEISTVRVPVTTHRVVEEEVISRMAVSGSSSGDPFASPGSSLAGSRLGIGGIANLDKDPPRRGTTSGGGDRLVRIPGGTSVSSEWRPATDAARR
jgi:hypothetical protein